MAIIDNEMLWRQFGAAIDMLRDALRVGQEGRLIAVDIQPEMIARLEQRVREGGHNVPEDVIRRRFKSGWNNFERLYKGIVDEWALYDNAGRQPVLLNEGERDV